MNNATRATLTRAWIRLRCAGAGYTYANATTSPVINPPRCPCQLIRGMVKVANTIKDDSFVGGNAGRGNGATTALIIDGKTLPAGGNPTVLRQVNLAPSTAQTGTRVLFASAAGRRPYDSASYRPGTAYVADMRPGLPRELGVSVKVELRKERAGLVARRNG